MDNLTHSLIGAMIGQTGLKRLSGLGMPTLIIAANIPDIDATCTVYGLESLAMRRGITHGPPAMLLLPLLLAGAMWLFDRWQTRRGTRPDDRLPVRFGALYLLGLVGTLSHPLFDWFNNYGVRLLEPFSHRWFYGDTLFIIDIWLWVLLIGGYLWTRRLERRGGDWRRGGRIIVGIAAAFILTNGLITRHAEQQALALLRERVPPGATMADPLVAATPVPFAFWQREILWRDETRYGQGRYQLGRGATLDAGSRRHGMDDPRVATVAAHDPDARAFLFWSRMPVAQFEHGDLVLTDQRFMHPLSRDRFTVRVPTTEQSSLPPAY